MSWSKWGKYFRIVYYFSPMLLIKAVTFATYAFLASSLLVPFFLFQASHLALPFKSNKPGFAGNKRGFESLQCRSFNNNNDCLIRNACKAKLWVAKPGEEYWWMNNHHRWPQPNMQHDLQLNRLVSLHNTWIIKPQYCKDTAWKPQQ